MPFIKCENLSFSYHGKQVVTGLHFQVNPGDYLCIIGDNGAGKSTLVKGILGLKEPSSGQLEFSKDVKANEIGYLPQISDIQRDFPASVQEVVLSGTLNSMGWRPFYGRREKQLARQNMEWLDILNLQNRIYAQLSGGQQRRVLLARALCASSRFLLLDEPTAGLDAKTTEDFYQLIQALNQDLGISIVMVTHDLERAMTEADHILHLQNHQLFFGSRDEYMQSPLMKGGRHE